MKNIYTKAVAATIQEIGSKAKTFKGIAAAVVKFGKFSGFQPSKLPEPWRLDRLTVGSAIELDSEMYYGYRWSRIKDESAAQRAEDFIGKQGKVTNFGKADASVFGPAYRFSSSTINYRGNYRGCTGSFLHRYYQSCVGITRSGRSALVIRECVVLRRIIAPAGMLFDYDHLGPFLKRLSDGFDYHLTAEDWKAKDFATRCRKAMAKNWSARAAAAKVVKTEERKNKNMITEADRRGVRVGFADSITAGNCSAGTIKFCASHYLNPRLFYGASDLIRIANGEAQRVRLAIGCAIKRHDALTSAGSVVFYPMGKKI